MGKSMNNYSFINSKIVDYAEIVVCLFDSCNLSCVFCPQEHQSTLGMSENAILSKTKIISHWINKNHQTNFFKIHIMGGELFQDKLIRKNYLEIYQKFIDLIKANTRPDIEIVFNFVTNLVFSEEKLLKNFLDTNKLKVSISYDPKGRFNSSQKNIFLKNIDLFENYIEMVSIVLTKQNIEAIQAGDKVFSHLYSKYICDFDHFLPAVKNSDVLLPKDSQKRNFLKFLIDHYPKCLNIEPFISNEHSHKMTCTRGNSLTILPDDTIPKECSGSMFLKDEKPEILETPTIVSDYITKNNCYTCEYFQKCPFTCFVSVKYSKHKNDLESCLYKEVFDYAKS